MSQENTFINLRGKIDENESNINGSTESHNICLEKVFKISLKADAEKLGYFKLKHFTYVSLNMNNIDDALMERLGAYQAMNFNRFDYFKECFARADIKTISSSPNSTNIDETTIKEIIEIIIRYSITYGLEPEIFNSNSSSYELFQLINHSFNNHASYVFLKSIHITLKPEEYIPFYNQVLFVMLNKLKLFNCLATDPDYIECVDVLNYFTSEENTAKVLIESTAFLPSHEFISLIGDDISGRTVFGVLLNAICSHVYFTNSVYFNILTMSNSDIIGVMNSIRISLDNIYNKMIESVKRILAHPQLRDTAYIWFNLCMKTHEDRRKLGNTIFSVDGPSTPNGFFINLSYLAFKILSPISSDWYKLLSRVEYDYCVFDHIFTDLSNRSLQLTHRGETMLLPSQLDATESGKIFNFPTHWFYLCLKILHIGLIPAYERCLQFSMELSDLHNDHDEMEGMRNLSFMREEQICFTTQFMNPSNVDLVLEFCGSVSVFLLNAAGIRLCDGNEVDYENFEPNPDKFKYLPEYILENVANVIINIAQLDVRVFGRHGEQLAPIILCFSLFMGYKECVFNPHLRATLCRAINHLAVIPSPQENEVYYYIKSVFESTRSIAFILPKSLIRLFVDIEFTGHANEFQQKFTYRFQMYQILFYIWEFSDYQKTFVKLSTDGDIDGKDQLPIYLKFINLLINDATYLLDEAITRLVEIHELELEMSQPAFATLSLAERKEKKQQLDEISHAVEGYNMLSKHTIEALELLTAVTPKPFLTPMMLDRIAPMLNIFLRKLVDDKKNHLKVRNMSQLKFEPKELVSIICQIYLNLGDNESFLKAVILDERSFKMELPELALGILCRIKANPIFISNFDAFRSKIAERWRSIQDDDINPEEVPEEFVDPISFCIMHDPVKLPASNMVVDRTTITKHLLSDEIDPYTRSPLNVSMLIPQPQLKQLLQDWIVNYRKNK